MSYSRKILWPELGVIPLKSLSNKAFKKKLKAALNHPAIITQNRVIDCNPYFFLLLKLIIFKYGSIVMKQIALTLIIFFALATGLHAESTEKNIFNQHVKLNSCENFDPLAPLVAEVVKEALDDGMTMDTILQMARNAKCSVQILAIIDAQPYTEDPPVPLPQPEPWEKSPASPSTPQ